MVSCRWACHSAIAVSYQQSAISWKGGPVHLLVSVLAKPTSSSYNVVKHKILRSRDFTERGKTGWRSCFSAVLWMLPELVTTLRKEDVSPTVAVAGRIDDSNLNGNLADSVCVDDKGAHVGHVGFGAWKVGFGAWKCEVGDR